MKMYAFSRSNIPRAFYNSSTVKSSDVQDSIIMADSNNKANRLLLEGDSTSLKRRNGCINTSDKKEGNQLNENESEPWIPSNDKEAVCPSYSKYLYFLFAPTLIYRDHYPRTSSIRWDYVCWNLIQFFGCIVYGNVVLGRYITAFFKDFGHPDHPMSLVQLLNACFYLMLPSILCLILGFFLLLHAWHNAFAEILCFADRLFYKDWWNCTSFSAYYKTWNLLVHDWLYTYIFKDAWESGLGRKHKAVPTILVFVVSSLFHEYIMALSFNFFFPVLLFLFGGIGLALVFIRKTHNVVGNVFVWMSLIAGTGILTACYTMEFYARINCPPIDNGGVWDFFTPRSWTCNPIKWSV